MNEAILTSQINLLIAQKDLADKQYAYNCDQIAKRIAELQAQIAKLPKV